MQSSKKIVLGLAAVAAVAAVVIGLWRPRVGGPEQTPLLPIDDLRICQKGEKADCRRQREGTVGGTRTIQNRAGVRVGIVEVTYKNGRTGRAVLPRLDDLGAFSVGTPVKVWTYNRRVIQIENDKGLALSTRAHPKYRKTADPFWRWYAGVCLAVGAVLAIAFLVTLQPPQRRRR